MCYKRTKRAHCDDNRIALRRPFARRGDVDDGILQFLRVVDARVTLRTNLTIPIFIFHESCVLFTERVCVLCFTRSTRANVSAYIGNVVFMRRRAWGCAMARPKQRRKFAIITTSRPSNILMCSHRVFGKFCFQLVHLH